MSNPPTSSRVADRPRSSGASPASDHPRVRSAAQNLLQTYARFSPEAMAQLGMEGLDEEVRRILPEEGSLRADAFDAVRGDIRESLPQAEPSVREELEILLRAADHEVRRARLESHLIVPRLDLGRIVYHGVSALLDPQIESRRRPAVVRRLRRYAGLQEEPPLAEQAVVYLRDRLRRAGLITPFRAAVEREIGDLLHSIDACRDLLERYNVAAARRPWHALRTQLLEYGAFLRREVLPRARVDFRLPEDLYEAYVRRLGIDLDLDELTRRARAAVVELQFEKEALASALAQTNGWRESRFEAIFGRLRERPLGGRELLERYQRRFHDLDRILRREDLMTLPESSPAIRLATVEESRLLRSPRLRLPRLLGNTGETADLIIPELLPGPEHDSTLDFSYDAAIRPLLAREAFPGLGLLFAVSIESDHGPARRLLGFNPTAADGWALYAESLMRRLLPPEARLVSVQRKQLAALRAFLDPGLHLGLLLPEEAEQTLIDAGFSPTRARREIELYTFQEPGRAASGFAGETSLLELRGEVRTRLGGSFDERSFHDAVLGRGLAPPDLLRREVLRELVPGAERRLKRRDSSPEARGKYS